MGLNATYVSNDCQAAERYSGSFVINYFNDIRNRTMRFLLFLNKNISWVDSLSRFDNSIEGF